METPGIANGLLAPHPKPHTRNPEPYTGNTFGSGTFNADDALP